VWGSGSKGGREGGREGEVAVCKGERKNLMHVLAELIVNISFLMYFKGTGLYIKDGIDSLPNYFLGATI
jgi:hypothetical protein